MHIKLVTGFLLAALAVPAWPQTPAEEAGTDAVPEKIVVVGQRPGPGLWKISKGDHVLWIFGTYGPLPKDLRWRSTQLETIVANSQEFLLPPRATTTVGWFRSLTLLPYAIGIKKSPDGKTLRDVLPPEVYARWLPLRKKYFDDSDSIERERPYFVANALYRKGMMEAGLSGGDELGQAIHKIVHQHKLKVTNPAIALNVNSPAKAIKDFKKSPMDDVACFTATLARLESDIDGMRARGLAWATGDLDEIKKYKFAERQTACNDALSSMAFIKNDPEFNSTEERMRGAWLAAAEKSLETNNSTFATLSLYNILGDKSLIAALQSKGYTVESPE